MNVKACLRLVIAAALVAAAGCGPREDAEVVELAQATMVPGTWDCTTATYYLGRDFGKQSFEIVAPASQTYGPIDGAGDTVKLQTTDGLVFTWSSTALIRAAFVRADLPGTLLGEATNLVFAYAKRPEGGARSGAVYTTDKSNVRQPVRYVEFCFDPPAGDLCAGVTCTAVDSCHVAGTCDPTTGRCSTPAKADGAACDDGNACTQVDACQAGACIGTDPVLCGASDQCYRAGACDPASGTCSSPAVAPDGLACDDGRADTSPDACLGGACIGTSSGGTSHGSIGFGAGGPICAGGSQELALGITLPPDAVVDKVDVFLLFDDTGSFADVVPTVTSIFSQLVTQLQAALPTVSLGFGVGRFEDYGGPATGFTGEYATGRGFTLNQPIVTPDVAGFLTLINQALGREAPGYGGDGPEGAIEALKQIATGSGFDGNGNGSTLDSGPAGAVATQTSPGTSGDIPAFSSNVAPTSGSLGGVGFRPGALHLVINATDICPVSVFPAGAPIPTTLTGAGGVTVPTSALACGSTLGADGRYGYVSDALSMGANTVPDAVAPRGSATDPETVAALNALGVSVIGLAPYGVSIPNPVGPSWDPSTWLSAMALLTGATDASGDPLVFDVSGGAVPIRDAIVAAVTATLTKPRDVSLAFTPTPSGLTTSFTPPVVPGVGPGGRADFVVSFLGDGTAIDGAFDVLFVDVGSNATLGTIPVTIACGP